MTYEELMSYLDTLVPREFRMELGPMSEACHIMGEPQKAYRVVHIGGTNGKGSTAAFLSSILQESGYHAGVLTSPHLVDVRERICVDDQSIPREEMVRLAEEIREKLPDPYYLTYFEFLTLMGFMYFRERKVDVAVVETGLGGRLDATNVVDPAVAVLTPISLDHQHHLGTTLKRITTEKCGIIKRGKPTVSALQPEEVMLEIRRWCDDVGSPLFVADPDSVGEDLGLKGEHQRQNAACAVEAADLLADLGFTIGGVPAALAHTVWPGRLEHVHSRPTVLADGAHNLAGAESLARYVSTTLPKQNAVLMLSVLEGKDVVGMCRTLVPLFREVICVRAPSGRAASPKDIAATARSFGANVHTGEDIAGALREWMPRLQADDTLVVSGSLSAVGAARSYFIK